MDEMLDGIPESLNKSLGSSECLNQLTSFTSDDNNKNQGIKINDLPTELLTMIFMELDSVTREKIKGVCKGWREIVQGTKALRTHVRLEIKDLPLPIRFGQLAVPSPALYSLLTRFVTPELELLHLNGSWKPCGSGSDETVPEVLNMHVQQPWTELKIRTVDLLLINSSALIPLDICFMQSFKRIIFRNSDIHPILEIMYRGLRFVCDRRVSKRFDELHLNLADDPRQLINVFLDDSGPLTKSDFDVLTGTTLRIPVEWLHNFEDAFAKAGLELNLQDLLADVAAGRHIPKFIAETLISLPLRWE